MICPHCAFPNEPGARVCIKCHRSMEAPPADQGNGQPAGETGDLARACLDEARTMEQEGDLRGAFLRCQSLLIDHYGDIPDDAMASLYAYMGRISQKQGKPERAAKYLRKARTLNPRDPELRALVDEASAPPPADTQPETPATKPPPIPPATRHPAPLPVEQALSRAAEQVQPPSAPPAKKPATKPLPEEPAPEPEAKEPEPEPEAKEPAPELPAPEPEAVPQAAPVRLAWVAGFWIRSVAFFVDVLLVTFLAVVMMVLSASLLGSADQGAFAVFMESLTALAAALAVFILVLLAYLTLFARFGGQSAGKMLLGLRVVGLDGHSITTWQAARRAAGMLVAALPGLAGFFWTGFDLQRRGWHDRIGKTLVVRIQPPDSGQKNEPAEGGKTP